MRCSRHTELEASLQRKTYEVDEADDRVTEMYKEHDKLKKRVAKLQRQLDAKTKEAEKLQGEAVSIKQAELDANTLANKRISAEVSFAPTKPPGMERTASRPNVFDESAAKAPIAAATAGSKRSWEGEDHIKALAYRRPDDQASVTQSTPSSGRRKTAFAVHKPNANVLGAAVPGSEAMVKSKSSPDLDFVRPKKENIFSRPEGRPAVFRVPSSERTS